jgi:hypothetical protein
MKKLKEILEELKQQGPGTYSVQIEDDRRIGHMLVEIRGDQAICSPLDIYAKVWYERELREG